MTIHHGAVGKLKENTATESADNFGGFHGSLLYNSYG